ncbi:hypothetical protein JW865_04555 [Candidatus Bathyarchaeota archaeon]|nr:hypothetical protein [Candidatus Bathyarchaeota archaeon]
MNIKEARKILGKKYDRVSDKTIMKIVHELEELVDIIYSSYKNKKSVRNRE